MASAWTPGPLDAMPANSTPRLVIVEEPQERFRFRYESERGGTHGQLAGRSGKRGTFPTVELVGFFGRATIVCQLATKEEPELGKMPARHVHCLQGRLCEDGVAKITVSGENGLRAEFSGLGITHVTLNNAINKLKAYVLEDRRLQMGSQHMTVTEAEQRDIIKQAERHVKHMDMNTVRLLFRALVKDPSTGQLLDVCQPVLSQPVFDRKSPQTGELKIVQLSETFSPCTGDKEMWLLVERVQKNNVRVRFFEEDENQQEVWSAHGRILKCHHQFAIIIQTPAYWNMDLHEPANVFVQLERPSDGCVSVPRRFRYVERDQRTTKRMLEPVQEQDGTKPNLGTKRMALATGSGTVYFDLPTSLSGCRDALEDIKPDYQRFQRQIEDQKRQRHQENTGQRRRQMQQSRESYGQMPSTSRHQDLGSATKQTALPLQQHTGQWNLDDVSDFIREERFGSGALGGTLGVEDALSRVDPNSSASGKASAVTHHSPLSNEESMLLDQPLQQEYSAVQYQHSQSINESFEYFLNSQPDVPDPASGPAVADSGCADQLLAHEMGRMCLGRGDREASPGTQRQPVQVPSGLQHFAVTRDQLDVLRLLLGVENGDGNTALHAAAAHGEADRLARLLDAEPLLGERAELVSRPNADGQTPLHMAALAGDANCVRLLLRAGGQSHLPDRAGNSAVHLAAHSGSVAALRPLLDRLRQSGDLRRALEHTNFEGFAPLHVAVQAGHRDASRLLCETGSDLNAGDDAEGRTPLHLAVEAEDLALTRLLLDQGADVDAATFGDVTPLHVACRLGARPLVELLVAEGADPYRESVERLPAARSGTESADDEADDIDEPDQRLNAFLYAELNGHEELARLLVGRRPSARRRPGTPPGQASGADLREAARPTSGPPAAGADTPLPEEAVRRLAGLLDGGAWRTVAVALNLDQAAVADGSPTSNILRCASKYGITLSYLARVLGTFGLTEAQEEVLRHLGPSRLHHGSA